VQGNGAVHVVIAELMRAMHAQVGSEAGAIWPKLTEAAASRLPAVGHASITVVEHRDTIRSLAATDRHPQVLDQIQQRYMQGPCLESAREQQNRRIDDLGRETRWPNFIEQAISDTPIRSILSYPLFSHHDTCGALNLYADNAGAFGIHGAQIGSAFATHAALAVETFRREQQFHTVLVNRDLIGQAKGLLMERFNIDAVTAFSLLVELSKERQQSVPSIARRLVRRKHA
jgi:transcriptional regulator with GAF, ATPase, and Fis domain